MPNWAGMSKTAPDYRFLAIREPLDELDLGDGEQLPFPTMSFPTLGRYKLFGLVTNRTLAGDELIRWQRERCGKSEEAHAVMKDDLAGGRLPSGLFGANVSMAPRFSSKVTLENSPVWRARRSAEVVISASVVWRPSTTFQGGRNGIGGGVRLEANVLGQEIGVLAQAIA